MGWFVAAERRRGRALPRRASEREGMPRPCLAVTGGYVDGWPVCSGIPREPLETGAMWLRKFVAFGKLGRQRPCEDWGRPAQTRMQSWNALVV